MARAQRTGTGDLFATESKAKSKYSAKDIEILEGLEPVRRRPSMYIGGTDERGLHHLAAEVLDNAMDEAVAGHASAIDVELAADGTLTVRDNGRGIPVDPHPKVKSKSALEVIFTTLHAGGKFSGKVYQTSGGLHGVGVSVVNALAEWLRVEIARDRVLWAQEYCRGKPTTKLKQAGSVQNRRGTVVAFRPDPEIFAEAPTFKPQRLYRLARSKAYLFRGVEIRWQCDPALARGADVPPTEAFHFPGGLLEYMRTAMNDRPLVVPEVFSGEARSGDGRVEWAVAWPVDGEAFSSTYCNTVPTPAGGSHEAGMRSALAKGLRTFGELVNNRRAKQITTDDVADGTGMMLSLFIPNPQFQGQTKERLSMPEAARLVESVVKDHFDHWLSNDRQLASVLLDWAVERADERLRRRQNRELMRKTATRRTRLPGKLADCSRSSADGTELFLVEGDSAGGSAKQARNRETQAVLPLRGKILNVASASIEKQRANQELRDLIQALGCGAGKDFKVADLRYERVIIMTDADVDGAHIAALLMTFFYREMPGLIAAGHLHLAAPPLYRLSHGGETVFALDDADMKRLLAERFKGRGKVDISRFKGLGEMPAAQLKATTMDPARRVLLRVQVPNAADPKQSAEAKETARLVERLMGRKPEARFAFIQENARTARDLDV